MVLPGGIHMFYREQPEFDDVLRGLQALEGEINSIH
jgi:hypothetical protein